MTVKALHWFKYKGGNMIQINDDDLLECYESFFEKLAISAVFALILATI